MAREGAGELGVASESEDASQDVACGAVSTAATEAGGGACRAAAWGPCRLPARRGPGGWVEGGRVVERWTERAAGGGAERDELGDDAGVGLAVEHE